MRPASKPSPRCSMTGASRWKSSARHLARSDSGAAGKVVVEVGSVRPNRRIIPRAAYSGSRSIAAVQSAGFKTGLQRALGRVCPAGRTVTK